MTSENKNHNLVIIEYTYSPTNIPEKPYEHSESGLEIHISNGQVRCLAKGKDLTKDKRFLKEVDAKVRSLVDGFAITAHTKCDLSGYSTREKDAAGKEHITIYAKNAQIEMRGLSATVDFIVAGPDGRVKSDSRAERIKRNEDFAELVLQYQSSDPKKKQALELYKKSIQFPDHELAHLYDFLEYVKNCFGTKLVAVKSLKISRGKWEKLTKIANGPYYEGRHSGKHLGRSKAVKKAPERELREARQIAFLLLKSFLTYPSTV